MAKTKLTDREAKEVLLKWPGKTELWPRPYGIGYWIRAQPKVGKSPGPILSSPGASLFRTQPDGMWVYFRESESCDVVVVEVCGSPQNLNDKRSRYIPSCHSVILRCAKAWLKEDVPTKAGGTAPRWAASKCFRLEPEGDMFVPVRHLRVLYSLPDDLYHRWCNEHVPTGQEFYCPHSSLSAYNAPKMQTFLRQMSLASQFYIAPKG